MNRTLFSVLLLLAAGCSVNESSKEVEQQSNKVAEVSFDDIPSQVAGQLKIRELLLSDPHRPIYHFVSFEGRCMPFDPDGAIFWNGKYHLCYILVRTCSTGAGILPHCFRVRVI
ncbi:MAG: hypothetical protein ACYTEW_22735 [Planctomycetota bacterium]